MSTELATTGGPSGGTLALAGDQVEWTEVQQAALAHIGIDKAPAADQQVFRHVCQLTGLDPFRRQIYMIARKERGEEKWTIQTGIDGFRLVAEDHPQYAGTLDPQWCGPDGVWRDVWTDPKPPVAARVVVLRHDRAHPISLAVRFAEFAATFADGNLQGQWRSKPAHMIAKCAEAASLRKAFPRQLSGVYTDDEMDHVAQANRRQAAAAERTQTAVTVAELTGTASAPIPEPVPDTEPASDPEPAADAAGRMTNAQQGKLFVLLRDADIEDRKAWASGQLGREIGSYGELSVSDAALLIDRLEAGLAALDGDGEQGAGSES